MVIKGNSITSRPGSSVCLPKSKLQTRNSAGIYDDDFAPNQSIRQTMVPSGIKVVTSTGADNIGQIDMKVKKYAFNLEVVRN
jgi:hypothetical protein